MKEIPLTQGKVALVDDEDFEVLKLHKWFVIDQGCGINYAVRNTPTGLKKPRQRCVRMHRVIMGTPNGLETDHINGNGLDNRRENLRILTHQENMQNCAFHRSSKHIGTYKRSDIKTRPFQAQIHIKGKTINLGYYATEQAGQHVYDLACWLYGYGRSVYAL